MVDKEYEGIWNKIKVFIGIAIALAVGGGLLADSMTVVPAGHRGVLLEWGAPIRTIPEGLYFKIPIAHKVFLMDVRTQLYVTVLNAASVDLQAVSATVNLNYHVDTNKANVVYQELGTDYENKIIKPAVEELVKQSTALYKAEKLIEARAKVKDLVTEQLRERLMKYNIVIDEFTLVNYEFSSEFNKVIEQKQIAEQEKLREENKLEKIKVEAQQQVIQAEAEATAKVLRAEGEANATIITAEAEAAARLARGEAEASVQNLLKQELNQETLQKMWIEAWSGEFPKYMFGEIVPLMQMPFEESSDEIN